MLKLGGLGWICLFIVLAPLIGLLLGSVLMIVVLWLFRWASHGRVDRIFRWGQLISAALFSLGHGGNDAQKTMGIIFVLLIAGVNANPDAQWHGRYRLNEAALQKLPQAPTSVPAAVVSRLEGLKDQAFAAKAPLQEAIKERLQTDEYERYQQAVVQAADKPMVPTEVVLACHLAMGLGTLMGGWRIVKTMGQRIARLRPVDGFCAETGAALTLGFATFFKGIPVSTTHTITGAIVGVSAMKRLRSVRWAVAGRVVWAWVLTIPGAAVMAALSVFILKAIARI
jgi:PiT family inorganic phosphate transporter